VEANAGDLMEFDVSQAFQPAILLPEKSAGWKARPTLEIQNRTLKSQAFAVEAPSPPLERGLGGEDGRSPGKQLRIKIPEPCK